MITPRARMDRIKQKIAEEAWRRPLLSSGLWHHDDIRNNFYDAVYLFVAASEPAIPVTFHRNEALRLASAVLIKILSLQDRNPESPTFGHWPLHLGDDPELAAKNPLPAELMSCLMVFWYTRFAVRMDAPLADSFRHSIQLLYKCNFYRQPIKAFNHHDAKYTAVKLLFGHYFQDADLLACGRRDLRLITERIRNTGMTEYGALPWFWHWIQSLTSAYLYISDNGTREELACLLEELWHYRARHYLGGAWLGGRMRSLAVDLPRDRNVAFDYVQFGDFELPTQLSRVEFAGLVHFEASDEVRRTAWRTEPALIEYAIFPAEGGVPLHQSVYCTEHAATGGILERVTEFDNEQHRWEVTLPLSEARGANRLYLFSPGAGFVEGDPRHESEAGELLFSGHTVFGLYPAMESAEARIIGVLPQGDWMLKSAVAYGELPHLYAGVFMPDDFSVVDRSDYLELDSPGLAAGNGYVVEVIEKAVASAMGIHTLEEFAALMDTRRPQWSLDDEHMTVSYSNTTEDRLTLTVNVQGNVSRIRNGRKISSKQENV